MRWPAVAAIVLLLPLAGCLANPLPACRRDDAIPAFAAGDHALSLCVDGRQRTAVAVVPAGLDAPAPLLLMMHGGGGNGVHMRETYGMDPVAQDLGFVVVYPEGTPARRGGNVRTWNAMHCCGYALAHDAPDVAFLGELVDKLLAAWPLDAQRVGVAGHSNGAMMAYRLAAERSDVVASVMAVAGAIGGEPDPGDPVRRIAQPDEPVAVLIVHARDDPRVPFDGGEGDNVDGPRVDLSVFDATQFWITAAGGPGDGDVVEVDREDGVSEIRHPTRTAGVEVVVLATEGGHGWPGAHGGALIEAPTVPDASAEVGAFLLAHPRP